MVCHKKSFSSLLENNSFSSAVLSSRTIAEGVTPVAVYSLEAGVHAVFCFREVEGVDTQPVDIVIDMFDASCIFYQDVAGIVVALGNAVLHQFPKRNREILVGNFFRRGCRYWAAFGMPLWKQCCPD